MGYKTTPLSEIKFDSFLIIMDIDGVLMESKYGKIPNKPNSYLSVFAVDALNEIIDHYKANICMVSSWSNSFPDHKQYKEFLIKQRIHVNELYVGPHLNRANYVKKLIKRGMKRYLIIEPNSYQYIESLINDKNNPIQYKRILTTNPHRDLDKFDAILVTKNLKLDVE